MTNSKGAPKGRRPVVYVCAAKVGENNLVTTEIWIKDQAPEKPGKGLFPIELAKEQFKSLYGVEPVVISGPHSKKLLDANSTKPHEFLDPKDPSSKSRRPVVYVCIADINGSIVIEEIWVEDHAPDKPGKGIYPKDTAIRIFKEKHDLVRPIVSGPYGRKLLKTTAKKSSKRKIVKNISNVKFSNKKQISAVFDGWNGKFHFIDDDDYDGVFFYFNKVDKSEAKRVPAPGKVNLGDITKT